jgi:hypothetical protein
MKHIILLIIVFSSATLNAQGRYGRSRSEPAAEPASSIAGTSGFYLGLGFRHQTKTHYPDTSDNFLPSSYESKIFYADGAAIELGYSYMPTKSFGLTAGLSYGFPQKLARGTQAGQNIIITDTNIQVTEIVLGTQFRDDRLYVPVGLIYSLFKFSPYAGYPGSADAKGGVGYQAGLGFMINQRLSLEALYRATMTSLTINATGLTQDYGKGELSYLTLVGKVYF